jgi:hypothetical protein
MEACCLSLRWFFFQVGLSSRTEGAARQCRVHVSAAGVSLKLIFNTLMSFTGREFVGTTLELQ